VIYLIHVYFVFPAHTLDLIRHLKLGCMHAVDLICYLKLGAYVSV
jgi:hypothetical protein